eukprot:1176830-Prorocentrum_minimum.AAC.11
MGAALWNYYEHGELKSEGDSISEGIGQGRITENLKGWGEPARDGGCVDWQCRVSDEEAMPIIIDLLRHEGLALGTSSGMHTLHHHALVFSRHGGSHNNEAFEFNLERERPPKADSQHAHSSYLEESP